MPADTLCDQPASQPAGLRVVVWDRLRVIRESLAYFLQEQAQVAAVVAAHDVDEAVRHVRAGADVLIMDIAGGVETTALDGLEALRNLQVRVPTLLIGVDAADDFVAQVVAAGATGYCPKQASTEQFVAILISVASGQITVPDDSAATVAQSLTELQRRLRMVREGERRLTRREQEILRLLAEGVQRQEIADRLGASVNTIRTHVRSLMMKLGVHTQVAAAALGRQILAAPPSFPAQSRIAVHGIGAGGAAPVIVTTGDPDAKWRVVS